MKRKPCWFTKPNLCELISSYVNTFFYSNIQDCWPRHRVTFTSVPFLLFVFCICFHGVPNVTLQILPMQPCNANTYARVYNQRTDTKAFKAVTHRLCPLLLIGLMADKLGSYNVTFYTAGAILIVGASITSLMAFVKQPEEAEETSSYDEKLLVTEKVTAV